MPGGTPSLLSRTILYLALQFGFYAVALGMAAGLVALPFLLHRVTDRVHLDVGLLSFAGAIAIVLGILPSREPFEEPGPPLTRRREPRLFALLDELAERTGQRLPDEVYLQPGSQAGVVDHGGLLGWRGRRILGIGLPFFAGLTVAELKAVLAHEFGHFAGGETRLGGILHRTRAATWGTLARLERVGPWLAFLQRPLRAYARFHLRRTMSISRVQELAADRLAADLVGRAAFLSGLRKVHVLGDVFDAYVQDEVNPVLGCRHVPPLVEGFQRFLRAPRMSEAYQRALDGVVEAYRSGVSHLPAGAEIYDSHPWLHERVDALSTPDEAPPAADEPASSLVDDWPRLERALIARMLPDGPKFRSVDWDVVGDRVMVDDYRKRLLPLAKELSGYTIGGAGARLGEIAFPVGLAFARTVPDAPPVTDPHGIAQWGARALAYAVTVTLARRGWSVRFHPGEPLAVEGPAGVFELGKDYGALGIGRGTGTDDGSGWSRRCEELGISDWPLDVGEDTGAMEAEAPMPSRAPFPDRGQD